MNDKNCCTWKLGLCIRLARDTSRDSWQLSNRDASPAQRREYRRISREAMADARYWKKELAKVAQS